MWGSEEVSRAKLSRISAIFQGLIKVMWVIEKNQREYFEGKEKKVSELCVLRWSVVSDSLWPHKLEPARLLCPWGFFKQEYWSGLPCLLPEDLPNSGNEPRSPALQADYLLSESLGKPKEVVGGGSFTQLRPTLCNPMCYSPPGSSVHGISQSRILKWVAISFSRGIFPTQGSNLGLLHCRQEPPTEPLREALRPLGMSQ